MPTLLLHGEDDQTVPVRASSHLGFDVNYPRLTNDTAVKGG